jgi:hypothetical protein
MLRLVRGCSAPPHRIRYLLLLVSWISIACGPLAATGASAADVPPAAKDSVSADGHTRPTPATWMTTPATPAQSTAAQPKLATPPPAAPIPAGPKPKAYRLHLHGGLYEPIDVNAPSPTLGMRFGRRLGAHAQGGLLVDWAFERKNLEQPINGLPGLQPHLILARVDGHLVPGMLFLEVNLTEKRFLVPYAGIAAGYEWLFLQANDYRTDQKASATFANYAWQSWGGIGMRLDQGMHVDGEIFYNGGSLERDVPGPNPQGLREAVNVSGIGARVGLGFLF